MKGIQRVTQKFTVKEVGTRNLNRWLRVTSTSPPPPPWMEPEGTMWVLGQRAACGFLPCGSSVLMGLPKTNVPIFSNSTPRENHTPSELHRPCRRTFLNTI